jgi:toxin-antitoxin system PIN domain toxin
MTSFFPDLNVWLALSDGEHSHHSDAKAWFDRLPYDARLIFSSYTQIGLLRLLTNASVMGERVHTLRKAWAVYDHWLEDPLVDFCPDPRTIETAFRRVTEPFADLPASKWVGDCWLLAFAQATHSRLVTFDQALCDFAHKQGHAALRPG